MPHALEEQRLQNKATKGAEIGTTKQYVVLE
jgi:hypothetical protein